MIKKLRRKFVLAAMGASLLVLLAVFAVLLLATRQGMRDQSARQIELALNEASPPAAPGEPEKAPPPGGGFLAELLGAAEAPPHRGGCFVVLVTQEGGALVQRDPFFLQNELDSGEIAQLALEAVRRGQPQGELPQHQLRYGLREDRQGTWVAFADYSFQSAALVELAKNALLVGAAALLALFLASLPLARWAVGPVERAWNQQKQFVADASHELKTPLTVILSNADMLLDQPEGESRRWAENIQAEGLRMKELTEALLALARTDRPQAQLRRERVDLSYLTADCALAFEAAAYEAGHTLDQQVEEGLAVQGDPAELARLVEILLDNALRYSAPKGRVEVELHRTGRKVRLKVENPGEPIPAEDLTRVFQRFYRADPSRSQEGYGLGLSIAKGVAEAHRGRVWAESGDGKNRFFVELPLSGGHSKPT